MKQEQKVGHQSQEQDLESMQQTKIIHHPRTPKNKVDEKPSITNEKGNAVNKHTDDAGKGYNENKPTDAGADVITERPDEEESRLPQKTVTVPASNKPIEQQENHEEVEKFLKRAKQAENVQG